MVVSNSVIIHIHIWRADIMRRWIRNKLRARFSIPKRTCPVIITFILFRESRSVLVDAHRISVASNLHTISNFSYYSNLRSTSSILKTEKFMWHPEYLRMRNNVSARCRPLFFSTKVFYICRFESLRNGSWVPRCNREQTNTKYANFNNDRNMTK